MTINKDGRQYGVRPPSGVRPVGIGVWCACFLFCPCGGRRPVEITRSRSPADSIKTDSNYEQAYYEHNMTKITASNLPTLSEISPHCVKYYKPLQKKKKAIDLEEIGTPRYNLLLDLMKCQVKHPNKNNLSDNEETMIDAKPCAKVEKAYNSCHSGIMGVGNYKGRKNCGNEIESLFSCVNPKSSTLPQE